MQDDPTSPRSSPPRLLDRAERFLFPRQRSTDRGAPARRAGFEAKARRRLLAQRSAVAACSLTFIVAFVYAVYFYSTTRMRIEANPLISNLTKAGLTAAINVGNSPLCEGRECWVQRGFDDAAWKRVRIPMLPGEDLFSLPGFKNAAATHSVYYRMKIDFTPAQINQGDELAFTVMYAQHSRFEVYLNGRLVQAGNGRSWISSTPVISIPRADLVDGAAELVFKGTTDRQFPGIMSRAAAYAGPKLILDEIVVHTERSQGTYHLLFMLTKGGIFIVFALFFVFSHGQRGLGSFLVFSLFTVLENFFFGDFVEPFLGRAGKDAATCLARTMAINALFAYLASFCAVHRRRRLVGFFSASTLLVIAVLVVDYGWGTKTVDANALLATMNGFLVAALIGAMSIAALTYRMWRREGLAQQSTRPLRNLLVALGVYATLIVWDLSFNVYYGFDKRALFDLLLFYYIAYATARDFGHKEGQVRSLEAHMIDKRRMEAELQEAATVAKAFLPGSAPSWPGLGITVFHRPLTENSGDWYAFEAAKTRNLRHFLMCDITGHGVQAAIVVSACKTVLSLLVRNMPDALERPDFALLYARSLNDVLFHQGDGQHISTYLGLSFDLDEGVLHYSSGGHPMPLFLDATLQPPKPAALVTKNTVLGALPTLDLKAASRPIREGDVVMAYTDGMPVSANMKTLREMVAVPAWFTSDGLKEMSRRIGEAHLAKTGNAPDDDVSVVCFRIEGVAGAREAG